MEAAKQLVRKCVACGLKQNRSNFLRILIDHKTGEYKVKPRSKDFGRSFYVCETKPCIDKLAKHKRYRNRLDFKNLLQGESTRQEYDNSRQN